MVDPGSMAVGGVVGAIIGLLWSDPYRDRKGRYTTYAQSHRSWLYQGMMGGIIGAVVTPTILRMMVSNPWIGPLMFLVGTFVIYVKFVDPR